MPELEPIQECDSNPFIEIAKKESQKSPQRFRLGAVLVKKGKIIATAHNPFRSHPEFGVEKMYGFMHAETAALYNATKRGLDVNGTTMYVYRKGHNCSKPCQKCMQLMQKYGVKKVVYST